MTWSPVHIFCSRILSYFFLSFPGLVDHNLHKGISHKLALEHDIPTARLPIDKFMAMKTRKVLTIDHVFRILGSITEGKTWQEALVGVMPPRKGATVKKGLSNGKEKDEEGKEEDSSKEATDENCEEKTTIAAEGCSDVDKK